MATTSVGAVSMDLTLNSKNYNKQLNAVTKSTESAFSSTMKKVGGFIAGAFAVKQVVDFTKTAVNSASKVQSAFTGLNSIVQGTGNSFSAAQKFINEYTADGLVSINEAATAYKNLLSRGYDTSQIEDVMTRLKDSAAFGRQASYDLGEAVVSATEGLKNENSILVDNAGVTKNVAKMWEEYADSIGVSTNNLTQAQKIQAEYNGIMKETQFQVGDASAYTKTFSGQVQQLKFNLNQMMVAVGKVVAPIAQLFIPIINNAISAVTNFFNSIQSVLKTFGLDMPDVVSKTSSAMTEVSTDIESTGNSAVSAAKKINKAFAGVDEINVLKTSDSSSSSGGSSSSGSSTGTVSSAAIDTASIGSSIDVIKDKLSELWNSDFIQSFTGAASTYFNFLKDLVFSVGSSIGNNLKNTWSDIQGNLATSVSNMSKLWTNFWNTTKSTIDIYGPSIISTITGLFNSIYTTAIGPIITLIVQAWTDFTIILSNLWNQYGATILNNIAQFVNNIWQLFQSIYTNIIEPVITPFLEMLSWLWEEHLSKLIESIGEFIAKLVNGALEIYNKFISPIVNFLLDIFGPVWSFVSSLIIDTFGTAFGAVSDILSGVFEALGGIIDFITGIFTGNWEKAWDGVVSIFKGIIDGIIGIFKAPFNFIIDGINAFIRALNKIKIPDWVPLVGGLGFNIPEIPKLAQGGYFKANQPQLAIVGDNTREAEIVTPESKIYDQVRNAIRDSGGAGKQEIEITIYHKYEDGRTIIQKINQAQIDAGQVLILS